MLSRRQIAALRKRMGLSQSEMAHTLGISSRFTVSQWERGASVPGGPVMRFLSLLSSLSDGELRRITRHLSRIGEAESSRKHRG